MARTARIEIAGIWCTPAGRSKLIPMRLLCLPHAGGGAAAYFRWTSALSAVTRVCAVRLPGRESLLAERPFTSSTAVIDELIELLMPDLDSPYAVFGHSMGAILAFELARRIEALKLPLPRILLVSGRPAPHLPPVSEPIHHLADVEFIAQIRARYQGIPDDLLEDREALRLFLPAIRADMRLIETWDYHPGLPLGVPMLALGGDRDPFASTEAVRAWRVHSKSQFEAQFWPGGHFYLHEHPEPVMAYLATRLAASTCQEPSPAVSRMA